MLILRANSLMLMPHLSDGGAELALEHLLQGLELVSRDVARLLQLLQQLDGSGNIWGERRSGGQGVRGSGGQGQHRISFIELSRANGMGRVPPFHKLIEEKEAAAFQDIYQTGFEESWAPLLASGVQRASWEAGSWEDNLWLLRIRKETGRFPAILSLCVASLALKVLGFQASLIERLGEKAKREN